MQQTDSTLITDTFQNTIVQTPVVYNQIPKTLPFVTTVINTDTVIPKIIDTSYLKCYKTANWEEILSAKNSHFIINENKAAIISSVKADSYNSNSEYVAREHSILYGYGINNLIIVLLFSSLVLLAWSKIAFGKYLNQILRAVFTYSDAYKLFRDHNTLLDRVYSLLNLVFVISGGLYCFHLFKLIKSSSYVNNSYSVLYICFCFVIVIVISRFVILKILGAILNQLQTFNEYLHSTFLYFKVIGLFLLPLVAIISYVSVEYRYIFLYFGLFVILLFYLVSVFRGTKIMLQKGILLFYWILYLCTVEFLPILLLYKFFNTLV